MLKIKFGKKMNLKGYTLVEGFPGIGWVATIAAGHLVEKLGMKEVGHVESDEFAPVSVIIKGRPSFPVRIYADEKNKLCVILSEFVIPSKSVYPLASEVIELAKKQGLKRIISFAGITSITPQAKKAYGIASNPGILEEFQELGIVPVEEGVTAGVSGILLAMCADEGVPGMGILVPTMQNIPDPGAAADLLEVFTRVTGVKVEVKDLRKEAEKIKEKVKTMLAQIEKGRKGYNKAEKQGYPSMYG